MLLIATILLAASASTTAAAPTSQPDEAANGGIVYGGSVGVVVNAPTGWVFDNTSGVDQGLHAVMYRQGTSWAKASEVIYLNFGNLKTGQSLDDFIEDDIADQKEESPQLAAERSEPIALVGGAKAELRIFTGDKWKNLEAVAYVAQDSGVAIFVLSCRTEDGFNRSLVAFKDLVRSSSLMRVIIKQ